MRCTSLSLSFLAFFTAYLTLTDCCFAGGSVEWKQVQAEIVKDDPFIADYIAKNFEMSPTGMGTRVGSDKNGDSLVPGLEVGTRIPPYRFLAKPLGASGDYTLHLTLDQGSIGKDNTTIWLLTLRKRFPGD